MVARPLRVLAPQHLGGLSAMTYRAPRGRKKIGLNFAVPAVAKKGKRPVSA